MIHIVVIIVLAIVGVGHAGDRIAGSVFRMRMLRLSRHL